MENKILINLYDDIETWHREHTAAEICVLEDVSNVYLGGRLCKYFSLLIDKNYFAF